MAEGGMHGGGDVWGACMAGGGGHVWWGTCMVGVCMMGGMHGRG